MKCKLKEPVFDKTGNKMIFKSAHKTFNKQTNYITDGNALTNTQSSSYVRPYKTAKNPVGQRVKFGAMQKWDLDNFRGMPYHVRKFVESKTKTKTAIVYRFYHTVKGRTVNDGWVVTTGRDEGNKLLGKFYSNDNWKSQDAVDKATEYVACSRKKLRKLM